MGGGGGTLAITKNIKTKVGNAHKWGVGATRLSPISVPMAMVGHEMNVH